MNYHIMIDDKFIDSFIEDVKSLDLENANRFFVRGQKQNARYVKSENVIWLDTENSIQELIKRMSTGDKLFVHWYDYNIGKFCIDLNPQVPLYAFFWGGEFYSEPENFNVRFLFDKHTLRLFRLSKFKFHGWSRFPIDVFDFFITTWKAQAKVRKEFLLKRETIQRLNYVVYPPNSDAEVQFIRKIFNAPEIKYKEGFYNQNFNGAQSIRNDLSGNKGKSIVILIGNSATYTNNHIDCFHWIKRLKIENPEIICPLNYGDDSYKKIVIQKGRKMFGSNFKPLEEFIDRKQYLQLLHSVDIGVFFHNRSQAFGNIVSLLSLGKKVYLKRNNPFYQYLRDLGIKLFETSSNVSASDMISPLTQNEINSNLKELSINLSDEKRLQCLKKLLTETSMP